MRETHGIEISLPLPRMSYEDAMNRYGSDKPDTRFGMLLTDVSEAVKDSDFKVFASAVANGGAVKAINVKGAAANYSRKDIDALGEFAANYGAKGLAWLKTEADGLKGPIAKFLPAKNRRHLFRRLTPQTGICFSLWPTRLEVANDALGALRLKLGKEPEPDR